MDKEIAHKKQLKLVSFNCKNVNTCKYVMDELLGKQKADIVFLQEHWLFDCQLHVLNEISELCVGKGKAVDTGDLILPVQMPRGYGGTAIVWKKQIDHLITPISDGGNRIQCVEVKGDDPLLLISVYMPCRGITNNSAEFRDVLDQLSVILLQYGSTHRTIIGGDMNEDMTLEENGTRLQCLREFMIEHYLETQPTQPTFVNPAGLKYLQ